MLSGRFSFQSAGVAGALAFCASCSSPNVNPPEPKAHRGYVEFYSPGNTNLLWEVKRAKPGTDAFKTVFARFEPLPDGVLRLQSEPGTWQFELNLLNRVVEAPLQVEVNVQPGKLTQVKVDLVPLGTISVTQRKQSVGANISGAGRKTRYSNQPGATQRLAASVQPPVPYRPKQQTVYPP